MIALVKRLQTPWYIPYVMPLLAIALTVGIMGLVFIYLGTELGLSSFAADWLVFGPTESCVFGNSVASAGDVNGDGFSDVVTGAFRYNYDGHTNCGRVFVWHGAATVPPLGAPGNEDYAASVTQDYAQTGYAVASAGDV